MYGRTERLTVSLQSEFIRITDKPLGKDRLTLNGSVEQIADDLRAYRDAGLDHIALRFAMARDSAELLHWMERLAADVRPLVA